MLRSLTFFFLFQLAGEALSVGLHAPIPGPVVGMILLFGYLSFRPAEVERLRQTAQELLRHLSLLFVPAGVGVMLYVDTIASEWLPILASIMLSTALTIVVTALTTRAVHRWMSGRAEPQPEANSQSRDERTP